MVNILPETQMGPLGAVIMWIAVALIIIVALFTTGLGPILVAIVPIVLVAAVLFIAGRRIWFRMTRGK